MVPPLCTELGLTQLIYEPTHINLNDPFKSTLIDLILTNKPINLYSCSRNFNPNFFFTWPPTQ